MVSKGKRKNAMNVTYKELEENDLDTLIEFYMNYYNAVGGTWTYDITYKRIHQMVTMEDSLVMLQYEQEKLVGFLMGYFKYFDDSVGFFVEEILVKSDCQHQGYGTDLLSHLKSELSQRNCNWIELLTTTGELHQRFYQKNGYQVSKNLVLEYMDL